MIQVPCHMDKLQGSPDLNPFTCVEEKNHRWMLSFTSFDLAMLKLIRKRHNVHFSSVIISALGGALRRYMLETGMRSESTLPPRLHMATTVPWPNHPSRNSSSPQQLCNHW
jgi:hypothetical protein